MWGQGWKKTIRKRILLWSGWAVISPGTEVLWRTWESPQWTFCHLKGIRFVSEIIVGTDREVDPQLVQTPSFDQWDFSKAFSSESGHKPLSQFIHFHLMPPFWSLSLSLHSVALEKQSYCVPEVEGKIKNNLLFIHNLCIIHNLLPKRIW
jgi:hypothetical protein